MRVRGFEEVVNDYTKSHEVKLPERSSVGSAGYDFFVCEDVTIEPQFWNIVGSVAVRVANCILGKTVDTENEKLQPVVVWTNVKAYMGNDEVLKLYNRSSNPKKLGLLLANAVGVIDSDYYSNKDNDGNIGFAFYNIFPFPVTLKKGDKLGQGIFQQYLKADGDNTYAERVGGFGSSGR